MKFVRDNMIWLLSILALMGDALVDSRAAADESPVAIIKARNETVEKILDEKAGKIDDATREELKEIINGFMDFEELSKRALGRYWDERTDAEKAAFVDVFSQLIKRSSVKKLEIYQADKMIYQEPEIKGDKAKVTTIAYKDRKEVEIVYRMHKVGDEWRVYDMDIDGVSTARNYRDSFYQQISKTSYKQMYDKLVTKLENDE